MFSQASVILFKGGGSMHGRAACVAGGVHAEGHAWQGGMHSRGVHGRAHMHGGGMRGGATAADGTHPTGRQSCISCVRK